MNAREASRPGPTALLAEDESLLADEMSDLLGAVWPDLRIVARASDGVAALNLFEIHAPDLAFLDIRMPLLDGIDVARHICHVVFITSYDQHAVEAFEAGAIDYVLKPPTAARLVTTVQRLKLRLKQQPTDLRGTLETFGASAPAARRHLQWINASRGAAVRLITVEEILYFKSDQKYTMVVTPDSESLIKKTIRELTDELDPALFWNVLRSKIVNLHTIESLIRVERGNLMLRLKQRRETLPVSDAYHHLFRQM